MPKKYKAIKDVDRDGWSTKQGDVKKGDILICLSMDRCPTLCLNGVPVCDEDSAMAKDFFELLSEEE